MSQFAIYMLFLLWMLPSFYMDKESKEERMNRLSNIAVAIDDASSKATCTDKYLQDPTCKKIWQRPKQDLALMLVTQGFWESRFAEHVDKNRCRISIGECDHGRAKTVWQIQRGHWVSDERWKKLQDGTLEGTIEAANVAAETLSLAGSRCGWTNEGTISLYATGKTCNWKGAPERVRLYHKLSAKYQSVSVTDVKGG